MMNYNIRDNQTFFVELKNLRRFYKFTLWAFLLLFCEGGQAAVGGAGAPAATSSWKDDAVKALFELKEQMLTESAQEKLENAADYIGRFNPKRRKAAKELKEFSEMLDNEPMSKQLKDMMSKIAGNLHSRGVGRSSVKALSKQFQLLDMRVKGRSISYDDIKRKTNDLLDDLSSKLVKRSDRKLIESIKEDLEMTGLTYKEAKGKALFRRFRNNRNKRLVGEGLMKLINGLKGDPGHERYLGKLQKIADLYKGEGSFLQTMEHYIDQAHFLVKSGTTKGFQEVKDDIEQDLNYLKDHMSSTYMQGKLDSVIDSLKSGYVLRRWNNGMKAAGQKLGQLAEEMGDGDPRFKKHIQDLGRYMARPGISADELERKRSIFRTDANRVIGE